MATDVGVCNSALVKIGAATITSLGDATKEARTCNEQYAKIRDAVLEAHPWNFAIKRSSLALSGTSPAFEYQNAFQLPADCLRVINVQEDDLEFHVEGQTLVTDEAVIQIRYISRIVDPSLFTATFSEALACRLAVELAYSLANNSALANTMMQAYLAQLKEARSTNAQGGGTPRSITASDWINSRF